MGIREELSNLIARELLYKPFANKLLRLASSMEIAAIQKILQDYLENRAIG